MLTLLLEMLFDWYYDCVACPWRDGTGMGLQSISLDTTRFIERYRDRASRVYIIKVIILNTEILLSFSLIIKVKAAVLYISMRLYIAYIILKARFQSPLFKK